MTGWGWIGIVAVGVVGLAFVLVSRRRSEDPYRTDRLPIESPQSAAPAPPTPGPADAGIAAVEQDIRDLLREGRRVEAVKLYRERHGGGLREAVEALDRLTEGGSRQSASGCAVSMGALALMLAVPLGLTTLCSPKLFSFVSTGAGLGLEALRACPPALERLGEDADAAWVGLTTMESSEGLREGHGSYDFAVRGSRARGSYRFSTRKSDGVWRFESGSLRLGGDTIRIPHDCEARTGLPQPRASHAFAASMRNRRERFRAPAGPVPGSFSRA